MIQGNRKKIGLFILMAHLVFPLFFLGCKNEKLYVISPTPTCWQPVTISINGPLASELDSINPFLDYRFDVVFSQGNKSYNVPGYYAADGYAAETSATSGDIWRAHFLPPTAGNWKFKTNFKKGKSIAVQNSSESSSTIGDGITGNFEVLPTDKSAPGFSSKGKLIFNGTRYLKFSETDEPFIKGGAGSPENFLAYHEFDATKRYLPNENREGEAYTTESLHHYKPHVKDWNANDPTWQDGKGKGIIGALNYLSKIGMNSLYFLAMNIEGDGKDIWPYINENERFRFDCSKLDQWNIVFDHMDSKGILMHLFLQETENETLLDNGDTKLERKIYLRELIARFAHHLGIIWNIGEENGPAHWSPIGQTDAQKKAMMDYIKEIDPYNNLVVVHSHSDMENRHSIFDSLIAYPSCDGLSMQIDNRRDVHKETIHWQQKSLESKKPWLVSMDEIGHFSRGVDPDDRPDNNQDSVRIEVLWGHLMAGGAGVEWYFGYKSHDNDLNCEDWRSRDQMWRYTNFALRFFQEQLPFTEMVPKDELVLSNNAWCLAKKDDTFAFYIPTGGTAEVNLTTVSGKYSGRWYNPRTGELSGENFEIEGGRIVLLKNPLGDDALDWVVVLRKG